MERTTFLGHYRTSVDNNAAPHELGRDGPATIYEAKDERSGETVALKLIPISSTDPATRNQFEEQAHAAARIHHVNVAKVFDFGREEDHFVYVTELLPGEPLASWVEQHGPMPADAVLRVAEQIVSVLSTARFHKLPHCKIEPSNLMIVPGSTPEGSWPFVKLMNFGLGELKSGPESSREMDSSPREPDKPAGGAERVQSPSVASPFASPEQLQNQTLDFRSEVYSLGATMYFMLTGVAPSAEMRHPSRELSGLPKGLRNLIGNMLHRDPDQRPKDPVVLAETIRECLVKTERRQELARRLGVPLAAKIPRKPRKTLTPLAQVMRGILVFAAILVAAGVLAAFLLPADINPFRRLYRSAKAIGVPIGVPEASPLMSQRPTNAAPIVANQPAMETAASPAEIKIPSPPPEQDQISNAGSVAAASPASPEEASPAPPATEQETSGQVADGTSASRDTETRSEPAANSRSASSSKKKRAPSTSQRRTSSGRPRMVGITSDGRLIYRLPSGRTRIVSPDSDQDELGPRRRGRAFIPQERDEIYAPSQPFPPDYFPDE